MIRKTYIERIRRLIYGGMPPDDASVTIGMVNNLLNDALADAAKANFFENLKVEGCRCVNSSFYTTFTDLPIASDNEFSIYNIALPEIPISLGKNEGVGAAYVIDEKGIVSKPVMFLSVSQVNYFEDFNLPSGLIGWMEGGVLKIKCPDVPLYKYTAKVRMVSGGLSSNMNSELNVPPDALSAMTAYLLKTLGFAQQIPKDLVSDGVDNK
jgi:hypothetical protein